MNGEVVTSVHQWVVSRLPELGFTYECPSDAESLFVGIKNDRNLALLAVFNGAFRQVGVRDSLNLVFVTVGFFRS